MTLKGTLMVPHHYKSGQGIPAWAAARKQPHVLPLEKERCSSSEDNLSYRMFKRNSLGSTSTYNLKLRQTATT